MCKCDLFTNHNRTIGCDESACVYKPPISTNIPLGPLRIYEDNVQHPKHYTFGKFEVIDVIEDWNLPFHLSNVVKYISRAGKKDPSKEKEDIRKALWYLERYLKTLDNKEG